MDDPKSLLDKIDREYDLISSHIREAQEGGPGSGNWGHAGIPGQRGGSASGGGGSQGGKEYTSFKSSDFSKGPEGGGLLKGGRELAGGKATTSAPKWERGSPKQTVDGKTSSGKEVRFLLSGPSDLNNQTLTMGYDDPGSGKWTGYEEYDSPLDAYHKIEDVLNKG